ncbi:MAG: ABC transporter permease [bacterium]|nr:ABC transporter permease [bacterium]
MAQFMEYVKMALQNLRSNKGRSLLTMLGIIIGISSVIMIISIGNGVKGSISADLNKMSSGQIGVSVDETKKKDNAFYFNQVDMDTIENNVSHVKGVTPGSNYRFWPTVTSPKATNQEAMLYVGTEAFQYAYPQPIMKGAYFTKEDVDSGAPVCVLTEMGARTLFGTTDNIIGMPIEINLWGMTADLTVVGIEKDSESSTMNMMTGANQTIMIQSPYTMMSTLFGWEMDEFDSFFIFSEAPEYSKTISTSVVKILEARYDVRGEGFFIINNSDDSLGQILDILSYITIFIVFVASISLLVGGIGVMNIMLVSVTERTQEIGIRKALGAKTNAIMTQFLAEAAMITLVGGIIGIFLGVLGAFGICSLLTSLKVLECSAKVTFSTVLIASVFSSAVGIFFGIYPAKKAARLSPIEALRHE